MNLEYVKNPKALEPEDARWAEAGDVFFIKDVDPEDNRAIFYFDDSIVVAFSRGSTIEESCYEEKESAQADLAGHIEWANRIVGGQSKPVSVVGSIFRANDLVRELSVKAEITHPFISRIAELEIALDEKESYWKEKLGLLQNIYKLKRERCNELAAENEALKAQVKKLERKIPRA